MQTTEVIHRLVLPCGCAEVGSRREPNAWDLPYRPQFAPLAGKPCPPPRFVQRNTPRAPSGPADHDQPARL